MTTTCSYNDFIHFVPSTSSGPASGASDIDEQDCKLDQFAVRGPPPRVALSELFRRLPRSPLPSHGTGIADSTLLAHYCQRTSITLAESGKSAMQSKIWRQAIPYAAYQHQCVSHAIAALAALHVWCERISQNQNAVTASSCALETAPRGDPELLTRRYLQQATIHHGHCLRWFQTELRSVGEHNVDAVLACSALLAPFRLAYSQVERRYSQTRQTEVHNPKDNSRGLAQQNEQRRHLGESLNITIDLTWINLMRGITPSVRITELQRVGGSAILPLLQWSEDERQIMLQARTPGQAISHPNRGPSTPEHSLLSTILAEGEPALAALQKQLEVIQMQQESLSQGQQPCPSSNLEVCLEAVRTLQIIGRQFALVKAGNRRFLMAWVLPLDDTYVKLLAEKDVIAMAVYAHFLAYVILLEDLWWVGDLGVATIRNILEGFGVVGCRWCSDDGRPHQSTPEDKTGTVQESLNVQGLFAWPARVLKLRKRFSLSYGSTGKQRERSLPLR